MSFQRQRQIKAIEERKRMVAPFVQRTLSENNVGDGVRTFRWYLFSLFYLEVKKTNTFSISSLLHAYLYSTFFSPVSLEKNWEA